MRLNQITAPAHDIARSVAFYELLGLRLIVRTDRYARFELPEGEATFSVHLVEGAIPRENTPHLFFETRDVDFQVRRLIHAGVEIERGPADQRWLWREAWLRDPAGNSICIFHAGENRRYPPWRIDAPPPAKNLHLVIREHSPFALAKCDGEEAWRALQDEFSDYKSSLGPFDLFSLLAMLEDQWPEIFLAHQGAIRAFAENGETRLSL